VSAKDEFPDIQTIRNAIPKHCFEPSALRSLSYVVRDVIMVGSLGWAATTYIPTIEDATLRAVAWAVYGYIQGLFCTGIWILGHEAGHGAFSKHALLNDVVGWLTHSSLMVPYFSWKYSHHRHHRFTGHMEKDMVFVPKTREEHEKQKQETNDFVEYIEETPVYQALTLLLHQLFGWPLYLLLNISAGSDSVQRRSDNILRRSHFDPYSIVFRPSEAAYIALSDLGLATTLGCLYLLSGVVGTWTTVLLYAQPFFWVHHWLSTFSTQSVTRSD
jgi:bifunctional Delta-12/omega-3 fatty acid desaturase